MGENWLGMDCAELLGSALFVVMSVVVAWVVFIVLRGPARRLLGMNSRLSEARAFFVRALFVMLLLAAFAVSGGRMFNLADDAAFMEYVWQAAGNLDDVLGALMLVIGGYAVAILVLLLGLGRYRDE